ncbi:hypothetical protein KC318_g6885 [Hortaea werneckii]|nr:hypothetical protein KC334_g7321 [Hortaea werneckii]KAI7008569.1 hypothetical protein KC355_g6869 [Hortaea werneckii]KAI7665809.1 hypothetical protein KC318_g6885 [Hortaea werneckii]
MIASQDDSHFFGIPPEMRNAIYRELLTPEGGRRSVNILAVCKQANDEAKSILYEENNFELAISGFEALGNRCQTKTLFNNRQVRRLKQSFPLAQTPWPSLLLRLPKLVIVLDCSVRSRYRQNDSQTSLVIALNKILYDLWQFLRRSTKLKHVTVRVVGNARLVDHEVGYLAMPFTQDFSEEWDLEKLPADRIRVEIISNASLNSFSALGPYYKLSHEARSLLADARSQDDAAKQKAWFKTLSKVLLQARKLLDGNDPLGPATSRDLKSLTGKIQEAMGEGMMYLQEVATASSVESR